MRKNKTRRGTHGTRLQRALFSKGRSWGGGEISVKGTLLEHSRCDVPPRKMCLGAHELPSACQHKSLSTLGVSRKAGERIPGTRPRVYVAFRSEFGMNMVCCSNCAGHPRVSTARRSAKWSVTISYLTLSWSDTRGLAASSTQAR